MIMQKIINFFLGKVRFFVNDGVADIKSTPSYLTTITVNKGGRLEVGKGSVLQPYSTIRVAKKVVVGNDVMIAPYSFISDFQHDYKKVGKKRAESILQNDCIIKEGAWIGGGAIVIGSIIGKNAVVGANSIVINGSVDDNTIFIGDNRLQHKTRKIVF